MHSMTSVMAPNNMSGYKAFGKSLWIKKRQFTDEEREEGKALRQGMYIFGGVNQNGSLLNDLWILEPYYAEN